jgi:hypothetical protein
MSFRKILTLITFSREVPAAFSTADKFFKTCCYIVCQRFQCLLLGTYSAIRHIALDKLASCGVGANLPGAVHQSIVDKSLRQDGNWGRSVFGKNLLSVGHFAIRINQNSINVGYGQEKSLFRFLIQHNTPPPLHPTTPPEMSTITVGGGKELPAGGSGCIYVSQDSKL